MGDSFEVNTRWQGKWDNNEVRWHKDVVNENLETFFLDLVPSGESTEGRTVFVPLCGKTLDMRWLYDKGFTVIGVEAIERAVLEFFEEQKMEYDVEKVGAFDVYTSKNGKIKLFQGNLFDFTEDLVGGKLDHSWDRGSLVAIDKDTRQRYGELFSSVMKPISTGLLEVFEYDSSLHSEQPFPIFPETIEAVFSPSFGFKELRKQEDSKSSFPRTKITYKMSRK